MAERDDDLRRRFHRLREDDRAATPSFARTLAGARARRSRRPGLMWLLATAAALVVVAVAVCWTTPWSPERLPTDATATAPALDDDWIAPTDRFLASMEPEPPVPDSVSRFADESDSLVGFSSPTAGLLDLDAPAHRRVP